MKLSNDLVKAILAALIIIGIFSLSAYILYLLESGNVSQVECAIIAIMVNQSWSELKEIRLAYFRSNLEKEKLNVE